MNAEADRHGSSPVLASAQSNSHKVSTGRSCVRNGCSVRSSLLSPWPYPALSHLLTYFCRVVRTDVFDGATMVMTVYIFLFAHPVFLIPSKPATPGPFPATEQLTLQIHRSPSGSTRGSGERQYRGEAGSFERSASSVKV